MLPSWQEALDQVMQDASGGRNVPPQPVHVMRFGAQSDMRGIIAPSADADRAVRYLTKYLTKSVADAYSDRELTSTSKLPTDQHIDRLHGELLFLPCSPRCANWLRYGIQPDQPTPGLIPGRCPSRAHDRENLGLGGRRVLVSRDWSGKTLAEHKADRATVVREALLSAGVVAPEVERMAADVLASDGLPRFVWTDSRPEPAAYPQVLLRSITERQRWRERYRAAVETVSATGPPDETGVLLD